MNTASAPSSISEKVTGILAASLNPIVARGVFRYALNRSGLTETSLDRQGLSLSFLRELEHAIVQMTDAESGQRRCVGKIRRLLGDQPARRADANGPAQQERIIIKNESDIVRARGVARAMARQLGFNTTDQTKIATAVSEVSRNICNYAGEGSVVCTSLNGSRTGLRIEAHDRGPGIKDIDAILDGRYASKTGLGLGLRGCKRLMDRFDVSTAPSQGTSVVMEKLV